MACTAASCDAAMQEISPTVLIQHGQQELLLVSKRCADSHQPWLQMVPRGWWKLGLLEDLKYYKPFSAAT